MEKRKESEGEILFKHFFLIINNLRAIFQEKNKKENKARTKALRDQESNFLCFTLCSTNYKLPYNFCATKKLKRKKKNSLSSNLCKIEVGDFFILFKFFFFSFLRERSRE